MNQIIIEPGLVQKLSELSGQAVLCDANGRAIGFFSPLPTEIQVEDLQLVPPHSIAETEELRKARGGKPLSEIFDRLGLK